MSGTQQPVKAWASMAVVAGIAVFMFIIASAWRAGSVDTEGLVLEGSLARQGLDVATGYGCVACHTLDGSPGIGPTWLGMYGAIRPLVGGETVIADESYIRQSITQPAARQVAGFDNIMIPYFLSEQEMLAIIELSRQLGNDH